MLRFVLAFTVILAACESTSTSTSSSSSRNSCDSYLNEDGLGTVTLTVVNQRTEWVIIPSPCCNSRSPQMEVSFGTVTEAPINAPMSCACTCADFTVDGEGCGCSTERQEYRPIEPGGSVSFDWSGTYFEEAGLSEQCASSVNLVGPCSIERSVPAGELTFTLHLLSNVDLPVDPGCDDGVCITWPHTLDGDEETLTASVAFAAAGPQTLTVTVD